MFRQTFTLTVETGMGVGPNQVAKAVLYDLLNKGYTVGVTKVEIIEVSSERIEKPEKNGT